MGILQARILEWVAMPSSRGSSLPRHGTQVSCFAGGFFTVWTTREACLGCFSIILIIMLLINWIYSFISLYWPIVLFLFFFFFPATATTVLYPVLNESVLSFVKRQDGVGCAAGCVLSWVHPVHACVFPSLSVVTVKRCAGGAAPEPGTGQRAREDRVCFSAALGVLRNCEE